jgi:hypothetical protein
VSKHKSKFHGIRHFTFEPKGPGKRGKPRPVEDDYRLDPEYREMLMARLGRGGMVSPHP